MTPPYRSPDKKQIPHFYRFHGPEQFHKVSLFYFFFSSTLPPVSKGRVLIVTYVFPPEEGGVGMAAYEMACSLSSLDWDIHVLTRPLDSPDESFRSHQYSPLTTLPDTLTKDSARLREYLDGFLKDFRPDVIIYHSWADWCREKYGLSSAPVFTCPAGASMRKRQLLFIRHVKRSRLRHIIFLFLIPQHNAYAEQMEQAIGDDPRFRILYRLPRLEVEAAIMESDAVFLYSYQEQQPLSILEAMSCGVPWFAPDAGALSTLEGGIVLKNTSPSVLEKAVESLTDEKTRKLLGSKGRRQWEACYAPDAVNQEWEQLLFSSIRPEGKPPFASSIVREHLPTC